nr:hypothetical protein [uncultured Gellertiella sp.]
MLMDLTLSATEVIAPALLAKPPRAVAQKPLMDLRHQPQAKVLHGTILPTLLDEPLLEMELALTSFRPADQSFAGAVSAAAKHFGGEFLFELPAARHMANCERIAVLRFPSDAGRVTVFACLELDGETIRIDAPNERTRQLQDFADAFVRLLERF